MTYARTADEELPPASKMGIVVRNSKLIMVAGKNAAAQWADFRGKKTQDVLLAYLQSIGAILSSMTFIAKALGMDLLGFRQAEADAQELLSSAQKGALTFRALAPTNLGKVTMSMRDVLISTRELPSDADDAKDDLASPDVAPMDLIVFGSDLSIILSALVVIFKNLNGNPKGLIKARNESLRFFKVLSDDAMSAMPYPESTVEEGVDIVLAATLKKASALLRRNPKRGFELLGAVEQRIQELWG